MSDSRELYTLLLPTGRYFRKRMNNEGQSVIVVYEGKQVPVKAFPGNTSHEIKHLLKADIKDRLKFTLNLNLVRQLDGRKWYKKVYNEHLRNKK